MGRNFKIGPPSSQREPGNERDAVVAGILLRSAGASPAAKWKIVQEFFQDRFNPGEQPVVAELFRERNFVFLRRL